MANTAKNGYKVANGLR